MNNLEMHVSYITSMLRATRETERQNGSWGEFISLVITTPLF